MNGCIVLALTFALDCVSGQFPGCLPITQACIYGYTRDANGCFICASDSGANPGGDPLHQGGAGLSTEGPIINSPSVSMKFVTPCIAGSTCDLVCDDGFLSGPMNTCQYCICAAPDKTGYTAPCNGEPAVCDLHCSHGYVQKQDGCQLCQCMDPKPLVTDTPITKTTPLSMEECIMRINFCQIQHPFGFMTNKTCDMCIGKDEVYQFSNIPDERQPIIQLSNPCIQGYDICRIVCATGYRTGVRNCQYCACNNE